MACYFDARDWVRWISITLTLDCTGSYSYTKGGGTDTYSGSVSGSSALILTRIAFDRAVVPDHAQITGPNDFVTFRARRGCPAFLSATELYFAGEGSVGEISVSVTTPGGTDTESELSHFILRIALPELPTGASDCGNPETVITEMSGGALIVNPDEFLIGAELLDYITDLLVDWATGGTFSRTLNYDIYSPSDADDPSAVCGSGITTITADFAP